MKQKIYQPRLVWTLTTALIVALSLWLIVPLPAAAQSITDYFQLSYDPVSLSQSEIHGGEVFYATIIGRATCTKDLPLSVSEASITSRIVAQYAVSGTEVTLNPSYTVTINPFPYKKGDTTEINQVVALQFPPQAESGDYSIIGRLTEAKVKIGFAWLGVTDYLPQSQPIASVKYTASEVTPTPLPETTPTTTPTSVNTPAPVAPELGIPWWVWLIVTIAVITTVVNIISLRRRRTT